VTQIYSPAAAYSSETYGNVPRRARAAVAPESPYNAILAAGSGHPPGGPPGGFVGGSTLLPRAPAPAAPVCSRPAASAPAAAPGCCRCRCSRLLLPLPPCCRCRPAAAAAL